MTLHNTDPAVTDQRRGGPRARIRALLILGAAAGPLFYLSAFAQMATRPGFDLRVHPLSQLSTGDLGWVQMLTFVCAGFGVLSLAIGHRAIVVEGVGRLAIPVLIAIGGCGFIAAGIFPQDPAYGFPAGTPDGPASEMSWHALIHMVAAVVAFAAIAIASLIALVRAIRDRRFLAAGGSGIVAVALLAPVVPEFAGIQVAVTGLFAFGWCTLVALGLLKLPWPEAADDSLARTVVSKEM